MLSLNHSHVKRNTPAQAKRSNLRTVMRLVQAVHVALRQDSGNCADVLYSCRNACVLSVIGQ